MFKNRRLIFSALLLTFSSGTSQNVFASATVYVIPDTLPSCSMIEIAPTLSGYGSNDQEATVYVTPDTLPSCSMIEIAPILSVYGSNDQKAIKILGNAISQAINDGPAAFKKTVLELKNALVYKKTLLRNAISSCPNREQGWLQLGLLMLLVYPPAEEFFNLFVSQFLSSDKTTVVMPARINRALLEATFELLISEDFGYSTIAKNLWEANQTLYQDFKELNNLFKK